jgi:flagellar M-ring protein FliF
MNQINELIRQIQALVAGMNAQSRVMAVLMLGSILVGAGFLAQGYTAISVSKEYFLGGQSFSSEELDQMELALGAAGLRDYERVGNRIQFPSASKDAYLKALLDAKAMPKPLGSEMDEAFKSGNILESMSVTQMKFRNAKIKDMQAALRSFPFIKEALITYDERAEGFSSSKKKAVSVTITPRGSAELTASQKRSIITYIQKSFADLPSSNIALIDTRTGEAEVGNDDPEAMAHDQYLKTKSFHEQQLKRKAIELLTAYGDVQVAVNVELDNTLAEETEELKYNDKPTTVQSSTTKKELESQRSNAGGRPGTEPNALANRGASLANADQSSTTKEQTETERRITGNTLVSSKRVGLKVTNAMISVSIPFSYYQKAYLHTWQLRNPDQKPSDAPAPKESDLSQIRTETANNVKLKLDGILDKLTPGEDTLPRVTVTEHLDLPEPLPPEPSLMETSLAWFGQSWQTLALLGLAGAALVSLRSFAKSPPPSTAEPAFERGFDIPLDDASELNLTSLADDDSGPSSDGEEGDGDGTVQFRTTGAELKQGLTELVRANPDAAATLLRNWISDG